MNAFSENRPTNYISRDFLFYFQIYIWCDISNNTKRIFWEMQLSTVKSRNFHYTVFTPKMHFKNYILLEGKCVLGLFHFNSYVYYEIENKYNFLTGFPEKLTKNNISWVLGYRTVLYFLRVNVGALIIVILSVFVLFLLILVWTSLEVWL